MSILYLVSCENCEDLRQDGHQPDCETEGGQCLIPFVGEQEMRILDIYNKLILLRDLVGAENILKMHEATKDDIEYLAVIEAEMQKHKTRNPRP